MFLKQTLDFFYSIKCKDKKDGKTIFMRNIFFILTNVYIQMY